jgi:hypothetical protein
MPHYNRRGGFDVDSTDTLASDNTATELVFLNPPSEWFVTNEFNPSSSGGLVL